MGTDIDRLLVETAGDKERLETDVHQCYRFPGNAKSFGGTALVLNRTNRSVYH